VPECLQAAVGVDRQLAVEVERALQLVAPGLFAPGDPEYWIASSNPELDQPRRHAALRETGGDAWQALGLLCDPAWHERYQTAGAP